MPKKPAAVSRELTPKRFNADLGTMRPDVVLTIGGQDRQLSYDLASVALVEKLTGLNLFAASTADASSTTIRALLYAALLPHDATLTLDQVAEYSWANPEGHRIDLAALTDAQRAIFGGNRAALAVYGGASMADPTLAGRLSGITADTLVVWGEADRMFTPGYGKEYAAAIPGASFRLLPGAGHLPQLETPEAVLAAWFDSLPPAEETPAGEDPAQPAG